MFSDFCSRDLGQIVIMLNFTSHGVLLAAQDMSEARAESEQKERLDAAIQDHIILLLLQDNVKYPGEKPH